MLTRREAMFAMAAAASKTPVVESHIHLFSDDLKRFPYPANATYKPAAQPVEPYVKFTAEAGIAHVVIVHPEPYQDDHRYLEYCFTKEPSPGFFKGTCLFDPIAPETPARIEALVRKNPGRIVALRIHETRKAGAAATTTGPIKDRDLRDPAMRTTWNKCRELGLAIQMHFLPYFAPQIGELAEQFSGMPVILDHLARAWQGTPEDFENVLKLARLPQVYMKYSGIESVETKVFVRRAYDAFGPDRMIWGGLGYTMQQFEQQLKLFEVMFDYAGESERAKIKGLNAIKLFRW